MKRTITILLLSFSLSAIGQTTEIEYNYIRKGLQTSFEQGLDIKRGYGLLDLSTDQKFTNAVLSAKQVIRLKDSTIAGTWVKITVTGTFSGNGTYIFCIPGPNLTNQNSYGWPQFWEEIQKPGQETAKAALLQWLTYRYAYEANKANILSNNHR